MQRLALAPLLLVATLAACGSTPATPPAAPATGGRSPSSQTTDGLSVEEQHLLDGVARGAIDCRPVRDGLPAGTTAAIECVADDAGVATVAFATFTDEASLLAAYYGRMDAAGVKRNSVACVDGAGESPYMPGGDNVPSREGCYRNEAGSASYWATVPGDLLLLGVIGRSPDMAALREFAWLGNQDAPGMPTLWAAPAR